MESDSLLGSIYVGAEGPKVARLAVIGQSPGDEEEKDGRPLVGPAGRLLQECFREAGLRWERSYRTNVIKYRLAKGANPDDVKELIIKVWQKPLMKELRQLKRVRLFLTLGNEAMFAMAAQWGITHYRGRMVRGRVLGMKLPVLPTIHPAYVLRTEDKTLARNWLMTDLEKARDYLEEAASQ